MTSKLKIFLKSGHTIDVECEDWCFTKDNFTDSYTKYEIENIKHPKYLSLLLSEIVGFIQIE